MYAVPITGYGGRRNFYEGDHQAQMKAIKVPEVKCGRKFPLSCRRGVVFHHCHTFHGSGPEYFGETAFKFAPAPATEKAQPDRRLNTRVCSNLHDPLRASILYSAE